MLAWVRDQNWTYSRNLQELQSGPRSSGTSTFLVFEGLDTFTTITMCGAQVATTENMYRQYVFEISDILTSCGGSPELSIGFGPATAITHQLSAEGMDGEYD